MRFPFFLGKREIHKQNSKEISGKGRENPGTVPGESRENFVSVCVFFGGFFLALTSSY